MGLVLVAVAVVAGCDGRAPPPRAAAGPRAVPVEVVRVEVETVARPIRVTGTLSPEDELSLAFKVGGVVARVAVEEGDTVRRGQVLASIELSEIDAQVAQAEQAFEKARRDHERAEKLASVVTVEQRQDAATGLELARRQLEIARFNRSYAVITAPTGGRVLRRMASPGELIAPGAPVLRLGSVERGWVVRATLTDRERVRVSIGDTATLRFDALGDAEVTARVAELASAPSAATGTYAVELEVAAAHDARLVTGLFARGHLVPSATETVTWIPPAALLEADGQRGFVYVLTPDRLGLSRLAVKLGAIDGDRVAVLSGLEAGHEVVVAGAAYLVEGAPIEIRPTTTVARAR